MHRWCRPRTRKAEEVEAIRLIVDECVRCIEQPFLRDGIDRAAVEYLDMARARLDVERERLDTAEIGVHEARVGRDVDNPNVELARIGHRIQPGNVRVRW